MKAAGRFEPGVLPSVRLLRRSHFLPHRIGIAVRLIDPELADQSTMQHKWKTCDCNRGCKRMILLFIVVIVPHQDSRLVIAPRSHGIQIRTGADPACKELVQIDRAIALCFDAIAGHKGHHPEEVENRLIDAVRRQRAKAFKVITFFKFKRPTQHGDQIDAEAIRKIEIPL